MGHQFVARDVALIELWHCPDARSFRVLWALEELGLPYTLHLLPFPPRAKAPEYLEINPPADFGLPPPRLMKQADETTEEWVRMYRDGSSRG